MNNKDSRERILSLFESSPRKTFTQKEIAVELSLRGKDLKALPKLLRALMSRGELVAAGQRQYRLGRPVQLLEGTLKPMRSGAGLLTDRDSGTSVMVPLRSLAMALPGDTVQVRLDNAAADDERASGRVVRIVARGQRDIVGTLRKRGRGLMVVPMNPAYKKPFRVRDAGGAVPGDRVVLRFSAWDSPTEDPEGEIVDIIGPADRPSLDTVAIIRQYGLPEKFPADVVREAEKVSSHLADPGEREDLRDLFLYTVDPVTARDFDDALSLEKDEEGRRVLGVHIADVSHFVPVGSRLDREARRRGTSVYLVDRVLPMLPEQLSNGVCSLRPGEDKLAFSVFLTFDEGGTVIGRRFCKSIIRSRLRLTYEQALAVIEKREGEAGTAIKPAALQRIRETDLLAKQLRAARMRRSALNLVAPEMQVLIDPEGRMTGVRPSPYDASHELIEECMVAANEAVAAELANKRLAFISRFHDAPDPEKLEELSAELAGLGIKAGDLTKPANLAALLRSMRDQPLEHYVNMLVLRSLKRAEYNAERKGHFGLAKKFYSHFTAPIRRYPDLVTHRQLADLLAGVPRSGMPKLSLLREVALDSTEAEDRAEQASRDLVEIKKLRFLAQQIEEGNPLEYEAVIVKVAEFGFFAEVVELQISGMVHVSAMSGKFVHYNSGSGTLRAGAKTYGVGQKVRVFVAAVNLDERKIDFGMVHN